MTAHQKTIRALMQDKLATEANEKKNAQRRVKRNLKKKTLQNLDKFLSSSLDSLRSHFKAVADPSTRGLATELLFEHKSNEECFLRYTDKKKIAQNPLFKAFNRACKKADVDFSWSASHMAGTYQGDGDMSLPCTYDSLQLFVDLKRPYQGARKL